MKRRLADLIELFDGYLMLKGFASTRQVVLFSEELLPVDPKMKFDWGYTGDSPKRLAETIYEMLPDYLKEIPDSEMVINALVAIIPNGSFEIRINTKKWIKASKNPNENIHLYALMDFKVLDTWFSKFLDFPNLPYIDAKFENNSIEYRLLSKMLSNELAALQKYLSAKTNLKDESGADIEAKLTIDKSVKVATLENCLGSVMGFNGHNVSRHGY